MEQTPLYMQKNRWLNRVIQKKPYGDNEKAIEVILLHFDKSKRLSEGEAQAMPYLAAYGNLR